MLSRCGFEDLRGSVRRRAIGIKLWNGREERLSGIIISVAKQHSHNIILFNSQGKCLVFWVQTEKSLKSREVRFPISDQLLISTELSLKSEHPDMGNGHWIIQTPDRCTQTPDTREMHRHCTTRHSHSSLHSASSLS